MNKVKELKEQIEEDENISFITSSTEMNNTIDKRQFTPNKSRRNKHSKFTLKNAIGVFSRRKNKRIEKIKGKSKGNQFEETYSDFTKQIIILLFMCLMLIYVLNLYKYLLLPLFLGFFMLLLTQLKCFQVLKVYLFNQIKCEIAINA